MRLFLDLLEFGINIGYQVERILVNPDTQANETILDERQQKAFGIADYDDKNDYADAIEAYLISIGIASAEAKSIAKLAKDLAKDIA